MNYETEGLMRCPKCAATRTDEVTRWKARDAAEIEVVRWRACRRCGCTWQTREVDAQVLDSLAAALR